MTRQCECPVENPDCEHPTCPRYPQPGHLAAEAYDALWAVDWSEPYGDNADEL